MAENKECQYDTKDQVDAFFICKQKKVVQYSSVQFFFWTDPDHLWPFYNLSYSTAYLEFFYIILGDFSQNDVIWCKILSFYWP